MGVAKDASIPPFDVLEDRYSFGAFSLVFEDNRVVQVVAPPPAANVELVAP